MAHKRLDALWKTCYFWSMSRWPHAILLIGIVGIFFAMALVTPRSTGFGTHESFGLPPCLFRALFSIPCPTCGITTSLAALLHGDYSLALRANPAGVGYLLAGIGLLCGACYGCWRPFRWGRCIGHRWFHHGVVTMTGGLLAVWIVRLATHAG